MSKPHPLVSIFNLKLPQSSPKSSPPQRVLFLGEGDFSFSSSLLANLLSTQPNTKEKMFQGLNWTSTSYETLPTVMKKYPTSKGNIKNLQSHGVKVLGSVDATSISSTLNSPSAVTPLNPLQPYDVIIFMFPHCGFQRVHLNRALLTSFFKSANRSISKEGTCWVTTKRGQNYEGWNVVGRAEEGGMKIVKEWNWDLRRYGLRGYGHVTTVGVDAVVGIGGGNVEQGWVRGFKKGRAGREGGKETVEDMVNDKIKEKNGGGEKGGKRKYNIMLEESDDEDFRDDDERERDMFGEGSSPVPSSSSDDEGNRRASKPTVSGSNYNHREREVVGSLEEGEKITEGGGKKKKKKKKKKKRNNPRNPSS